MPIAQASAHKQNLRNAIAERVGDRLPFVTTAAGTTTTVVSTALTGYPDDYFNNWFGLDESGAAISTFREITDFTQSSGTVTAGRAWANTGGTATAPGNNATCSLWKYSPAVYTIASNTAIRKVFPACYKLETDYGIVLASDRRAMGVPRGITNLWGVAIEAEGSQMLKDRFDRADSTTSIGGSWVATVGTWGVSSERGYSVSDADADFITYDGGMEDGMVSVIIRGDLTTANYRVPVIAFRIREDYLGAIDTTNCLLIEVRDSLVDLRKVDAGSESSLTTAAATTSDGTDYVVRVRFEGPAITVWLDDVEVISYALTGLNLKYLDFPRVGIRWDVSGTPTVAARIDDFRAHKIVPFLDLNDWRVTPDKRVVEIGKVGRSGLIADRWLRFQGGALLTALAEDTTPGTLASDTTATMEITTGSPEWDVLVEYGVACLYERLATLAFGGSPEDRAEWKALQAEAMQRAMAARAKDAMPRPRRGPAFPGQW